MTAPAEPDAAPPCGPYVCAYPDPRGYRWRARWTCPRCGNLYRLTRRKPWRRWRRTYAPNGAWVLVWPGIVPILRAMAAERGRR